MSIAATTMIEAIGAMFLLVIGPGFTISKEA
jgi:hypothetical protein